MSNDFYITKDKKEQGFQLCMSDLHAVFWFSIFVIAVVKYYF